MTIDSLHCPICDALKDVADDNTGEYCVLIKFPYNGDRPKAVQNLLNDYSVKVPTVVLKEHGEQPNRDGTLEALKMLGNFDGMIKSLDVAGHWGIQIMPGKWASKGKGQMYASKEGG